MSNPIEGSFELYFPHSNDGAGGAVIQVEDAASHVRVVDITIPFREFANAALRSRRGGKCTYALRGLLHVGRPAESKRVAIPVDRLALRRDPSLAAALLAPYEVDGWVGMPDDLMNYNRSDRKGAANVRFFRHVGPPALEIAMEVEQLRDKVALLRQALQCTKEALPVYSATSAMADAALEKTA